MTGSNNPPKISAPEVHQLPLKGFFSEVYKDERGHQFRFENVGDGRYRVHFLKRPPDKK